MKQFLCILTIGFIAAFPGIVKSATLYVDDDGTAGGNSPVYLHPQDAVNAASPGDIIKVYPGTYGSRIFTAPKPPHWTYPGDCVAPALVVYKDGLIIEAVDSDPAYTIIESTHNNWCNPVAIQASTGGEWNGSAYVGAGVNPGFGSAPNAAVIIASNVTIRGLTFRAPALVWNSAGVMIGGLYAGDPANLGSDGNTVENCCFKNVWHAVYIWHSSGNRVINNTVAELTTDHWAAISAYDGYNDDQINLGHPSENNFIAGNTLSNKGIALGAWAPATWTSNAGSVVCCNAITQAGVTYSNGPVTLCCNTGGFWQQNTAQVAVVDGIAYAGATSVPAGSVALAAQVSYSGTSDGSGIPVCFTLDGSVHVSDTVAGGVASVTVDLTGGVYTVSVAPCCACCQIKDSVFLSVYDPAGGGFVSGGGWFESPAGAFTDDASLAGKASFGFVSKYQKGASVPTGNTEFQFRVANVNFKSASYDWLVVAGDKAKYKGMGTINGEGNYQFMVTALDGDLLGKTCPDKFRIKISDGGRVIYDNKIGAGDDGYDATELGGGSVVIHAGKVAKPAAEQEIPAEFALQQNSPNPFNPSTAISFAIPGSQPVPVHLNIYDLRGGLVRKLVNDIRAPGMHTVKWDAVDDSGRQVSSGIYLYKLTAGSVIQSRKMLLMR